MPLTTKWKSDSNFCELCGEQVKWVRLESGAWIAVDEMPIFYLPHAGKEWLVGGLRSGSKLLKDCKIWRAGRNMPQAGLKRGYLPHAFSCPMNERAGGKEDKAKAHDEGRRANR